MAALQQVQPETPAATVAVAAQPIVVNTGVLNPRPPVEGKDDDYSSFESSLPQRLRMEQMKGAQRRTDLIMMTPL